MEPNKKKIWKWKMTLTDPPLLIIFVWFWRHSSVDSQNYYITIWFERQVWFGDTIQISLVWESSELCLIKNHAKIINSGYLTWSIRPTFAIIGTNRFGCKRIQNMSFKDYVGGFSRFIFYGKCFKVKSYFNFAITLFSSSTSD